MKNLIFVISLILLSPLLLLALSPSKSSYTVMNKNNITVETWSHGSFSYPGNRVSNFRWKGLGYAFEFNFFIAAEVEVPKGSHPDVIEIEENGKKKYIAHIISDGLESNGGEFTLFGFKKWGWEKMRSSSDGQQAYFQNEYDLKLPVGYAEHPTYNERPAFWPYAWLKTTDYQWPTLWHKTRLIGDQETIYGMDDRSNAEFEYYPFSQDSTRRGLGVEVETRVFALQDFYEDALFATFELKNVSDKDLDKMLFGVWGDPHIGGNMDWRDDLTQYDSTHNLIYSWDADGHSLTNPDITPGYFGIALVQTPSAHTNQKDDDGDGMIDESPFDGVDNDNDWNVLFDDIGADGIANTGDLGEKDGNPTLGEPNFEHKDSDEADQTGLQSFANPAFAAVRLNNDEKVWTNYLQPGHFEKDTQQGDNATLGGTGYFSLKKGQNQKVGIIFVFGEDYNKMIENLTKARTFYNSHIGSHSTTYQLALNTLMEDSVYTDDIPLSWDASALPADSKLEIAYSIDNRKNWHKAADNIANSGNYSLAISQLPNSAFYNLRLRAIAPSGQAYFQHNTFFGVDHSGSQNVAPEIIPLHEDGLVLTGQDTLRWLAKDVEGDPLSIKLIFSSPYVKDTLHVSGEKEVIPTRSLPNGPYTLTYLVFDGSDETMQTRQITIENSYETVNKEDVVHVQGHATGEVIAEIVDRNQIKGTLLKISFKDEGHFSIYDSLKGNYMYQNIPIAHYPATSFDADGLRIGFKNDLFGIDSTHTDWNKERKTNANFPKIKNKKTDFYDYAIIFYNEKSDTAVNGKAINYSVWDKISAKKMKTAWLSHHTNPNEGTIFILRGGETANHSVWEMEISYPTDKPAIYTAAGDTFNLTTKRPFSKADSYLIDTQPLPITHSGVIVSKPYLKQNYPNPFNHTTKIPFWLPQKQHVLIEIYDVLGRKVKTVCNKELEAGLHTVEWTGRNESHNVIASGLYFYRIQTENLVQSKKLLILK